MVAPAAGGLVAEDDLQAFGAARRGKQRLEDVADVLNPFGILFISAAVLNWPLIWWYEKEG